MEIMRKKRIQILNSNWIKLNILIDFVNFNIFIFVFNLNFFRSSPDTVKKWKEDLKEDASEYRENDATNIWKVRYN